MSPQMLQLLADDIKNNGLNEPIVTNHDGTILIDGRNRLRACGMLGVSPSFRRLPKDTPNAEILRVMVTANIATHPELTPGQLGVIGHRFTCEIEEVPDSDLSNFPERKHYDNHGRRSYAAAVMGISSKTIWQAKTIAMHNPDAIEQVVNGSIRLNAAYEAVMAERGMRKTPKKRFAVKELPIEPPHPKDNTQRAIDGRRTWLAYLAEKDNTAAEIAEVLQISEEHVRRLARRFNIELPGDAWAYKRRKPNFDPNRLIQVVADDLVSMDDSFGKIRDTIEDLNPDKIEEWAKIFARAARRIDRVARALRYGAPTTKRKDDDDDADSA